MNYKCSQIIWLEAKLRACYSLNQWDYEGHRDTLVCKLNTLMRCTHPKYGRVSEAFMRKKGMPVSTWADEVKRIVSDSWPYQDCLSTYEREQREIDFEMNAMSYDCGKSVSLDSIL